MKLHTSLLSDYSCAICGVSIEGLPPADLDRKLFDEYKIHTVSINRENIHCVRVIPHVYTRPQDLDKLVLALREITNSTRAKLGKGK